MKNIKRSYLSMTSFLVLVRIRTRRRRERHHIVDYLFSTKHLRVLCASVVKKISHPKSKISANFYKKNRMSIATSFDYVVGCGLESNCLAPFHSKGKS